MPLVAAVIAVCCLAGCSSTHAVQEPMRLASRPPIDLIELHRDVADTLYDAMCGWEHCEMPLLMSSFVSLDDLDQTSRLGRAIPQQLGSRLSQRGAHLVDVRLRTRSLLVRKDQGEFALSRDLEQINRDFTVFAVLTGTYTVVFGRVYVTAMVLRGSDGAVLASQDYILPMDRRSLRPGGGYPHTPGDSNPESLPDPFEGTIQPSVLTRLS